MNHSQIPLHIIDLQQIDLLTLDSIYLFTMNPLFSFMEFLNISTETLPPFSLKFKQIIQSFPKVTAIKSVKNQKPKKIKTKQQISKSQSKFIILMNFNFAEELFLSLPNSLLSLFLHFLLKLFKLFYSSTMSMFLKGFQAIQFNCYWFEKIIQKITAQRK